MGMHKGKKARSALLTEMHFVSALPLKKAVKLLGDQAAPETPVTLTETSSDKWHFEMAYHPAEDEPASAVVKGTLRRWEGTLTRLDCTGDVHRANGSRLAALIHSSGQVTTLMILVVGVVLFIIMNATHNPLVVMGSGVVIALIAALGTAGSLLRNPDAGEEIDTVYFRDRDALLQLLIDVYMAAGEVSIDGSGLKIKNEADVDFARQVLRQRRNRKPEHMHPRTAPNTGSIQP